MDNIKEFVLEKITKEDYCIVIGSEDAIDEFSVYFGVKVDIPMVDFRRQDKTKSQPMRVFNNGTKEFLTLGLVKKKYMENVISGIDVSDVKKEDIENITAVLIQKDHHIFTCKTKSDEEKAYLIDEIFKIPDEKIKNEMKIVTNNIKRKLDEEQHIGYV